MTKANAIKEIAARTGAEKAVVQEVVEAFFNVVQDSLRQEENVYFRGFGNFSLQKRAKKIGRNINKNTAMVVEEHYIVRFKPAIAFAEEIKKLKP